MSDVEALRARLSAQRADVQAAEAAAARARWSLAVAEEELARARHLGDVQALGRAERAREDAQRHRDEAAVAAGRLKEGVLGGLGEFVAGLPADPAERSDAVLAGVDQSLPIALLPVRLETRFAGPDAAPVLRVRIFPDDLHVDDHEPDLTPDEVGAGTGYWEAVTGGTPEAEAWTRLAASVGPHRALWVRERLERVGPAGALVVPEVQLRAPGSSRPAVARALPDVFLVRVTAGGRSTTTLGHPVADTLQVGIDLSGGAAGPASPGQPGPVDPAGGAPDPAGAGPDPAGAGPDPADPVAEDVLVLGEGMRWLSDFEAAVAAGMAVEVPLPAGTQLVDEVAVLGVCVSLLPDEAAALVSELVAHHRVSDGAGFVAPGTPTNNLADTSSGWQSRPDPARLDPSSRRAPGDASNAATLARALGLATADLAGLVGAADADAAEAEVMAHALFEATWGPYLRTQAQPGFPLALLPQVHAHVTTMVKGGGPLPAVRLGRQPYGILPIQPRGPWAPAGDDAFTTWLAGYLRRIRPLWLSGHGDAPSGVAAYAHEPVSTRFRLRTSNASSTRPWAAGFGIGDAGDGAAVQERRLVAELQLGAVLPTVVSQLFASRPVDLWMPMAADDDLDFLVSAPKPKEATSILGLLLRNAALQVTTNVADELLAPATELEIAGYAVQPAPTVSVTSPQGLAVSTTPEIAIGLAPTIQEKLARRVLDPDSGTEVAVAERIGSMLRPVGGPVANLRRYRHTDALLSYRSAHADLAAIPTERRARLAGEVLDCASHRYDAWVTSLATRRLGQLREARATGLQLGAWGVVQGVRRRALTPVVRPDLPEGTVRDDANRGFVVAPSTGHATVAGVLRAAWIAHDGPARDAEAPFAVDLRSRRVGQALDLAQGMRNGQQLGALLGYRLERALHDASGAGAEADWAVFVLRRRYPLMAASGEDAGLASQRLVADGWRVVQDALEDVEPLIDAVMAEVPAGIDRDASEAAVRGAIDDLVGAVDGFMDLGLAEALTQLSRSNYERASAATDMIGRAATPPDSFDVATTPRGGKAVEQRLAMTFGGLGRPAGWGSSTPRATLSPEADAFVGRRLGDPSSVTLRLLGEHGDVLATCPLASLGLAALDVAADAASTGSAAPFPLLLARARRVTGQDAASLATDPVADEALLDLLGRAARWHRALAGRRALSPATLSSRGSDVGVDPDTLVRVGKHADLLEAQLTAPGGLDDAVLELWSVEPGLGHAEAGAVLGRRLADSRAATEPVAAARALFGADCVVTGSVTLAHPAPWAGDQDALGVDRGRLVGWVQDAGRVRDAARALDDAMLHDELAGVAEPLGIAAGQTPALPFTPTADGGAGAAGGDRRWVGQAFPGTLGHEPVVSFVVVEGSDPDGGAGAGGPAGGQAGEDLVGLELDAWVEVVPDRTGAGAVAANLSSPDSRAPNTILLAVPADVDAPWTTASLFSVVDEALELAACRLVDLDASKRVPAVLPAIYVSEYDDETSWRHLVGERVGFPQRYVGRGTS